MITEKSISSKVLDLIIHSTMFVILVTTLYPVLHVFSASLSSQKAYDKGLVTIFPVEFNISAYKMIFNAGMVPHTFMNSVIYTSVGTIVNLVLTGSLAYALSRKRLELRGVYTGLIVFSMYFSGGLIPMFLLVSGLGLYNSMWALILPGAINTTNLIIMRTFFQSIPIELEESAFIDGANDFTIFTKIVLPLSKAAIMTIGLYYAVAHWNSWFSSMMYLKDTDKYPLQMTLRQLIIMSQSMQEAASSSDTSLVTTLGGLENLSGIKYATLFVSIFPMLLIYPFVQRYFIKGVMIGSLKG